MRVHFLASTLVRGGAETMAAALTRALIEEGHAASWTLLKGPGEVGRELASSTDVVHSIGRGIPKLCSRLAKAEGLYVLDHVDAVVLGSFAAPIARVRRRVVAVHTMGLPGGAPSLSRAFRLALPAYHGVLALSATHARYLVERERVPQRKVRVVPNGIDLSRFRNLPSREAARQALGLPEDAEIVGTVAVLRPEKNLDLLVRAAARLSAARPRLRIVIAGDGPERPRLESLTREARAEGVVCFLGARGDVPNVLAAFDLFALPSRPEVETQPLAVLESMAAGVPVLATQVGDLEAMLEGGGAGWLVPPGDPQAFESAILDLLADPDQRSSLAVQAQRAVEAYTVRASAQRLLATLEE